MATSNAQKRSSPKEATEESNPFKTCFVIMPISDTEGYAPGHFGRVYEYIIKPACKLAGFVPVRADEVKTTNYIAIDIVKKIVEADMALCDLSSQNANVLYEVGIRQAFNKPVSFIKDSITKRIFDIQGFRDISYDENLRIDTVQKTIIELKEVLLNTFKNKNEINSLITMLGIKPATVSETSITMDTELILNSIQELATRIQVVETKRAAGYKYGRFMKKSDAEPAINIPLPLLEPVKYMSSLRAGAKVYSKEHGYGNVVSMQYADEGEVVFVDFDSSAPLIEVGDPSSIFKVV